MSETQLIPLSQPPEDIESGKVMALLCYIPIAFIGLIVSIVCLVQANNGFSLYHAKQALALTIFGAVALIISWILCFVLIGFVLLPVLGITGLVLCIIGIVNAASGKYKPLPLLGNVANRWFQSIRKKA